MPARLQSTEALVLDRQPAAEHFVRLACFGPEAGALTCMQRHSRRAGGTASAPLDLFDRVQLELESPNEGQSWFVREATVLRRHAGLGASYAALKAASRFSRVLLDNPVSEESREAVYALALRAVDAWEAGTRPDAVYFKTLYLLARDEGHPVREAWERGLSSRDAGLVEAILRQPAAAQETPVAEVERLTAALERYLGDELDFRMGGA